MRVPLPFSRVHGLALVLAQTIHECVLQVCIEELIAVTENRLFHSTPSGRHILGCLFRSTRRLWRDPTKVV